MLFINRPGLGLYALAPARSTIKIETRLNSKVSVNPLTLYFNHFAAVLPQILGSSAFSGVTSIPCTFNHLWPK